MLFQVFIVPTRRLMWATYGLFLVVLFFTIAAGCSPATDTSNQLPPPPQEVDAGVDSITVPQPDASPQQPDAMVAVDSLPPDSQVVPDALMPDSSPPDSTPTYCHNAGSNGICNWCKSGGPISSGDIQLACNTCEGADFSNGCYSCSFLGSTAWGTQTDQNGTCSVSYRIFTSSGAIWSYYCPYSSSPCVVGHWL